jgi:flagellar basal body-associated protein FliL
MLAKLTGNKMMLGAVVGIVGGLIVAVLLVVIGGVGRTPSATAEAAKSGEKVATAAKAPAKAAAAGTHSDTKFGPTYVIKDRIVNLADPGGRRYLRFSVTLQFEPVSAAQSSDAPAGQGGYQQMVYIPELDAPSTAGTLVTGGAKDPDKDFQGLIKPYAAAIEDAVTSVLSSKTYDEVRGEGKEQAKREIKDRVQRIVADKYVVSDVYLTDFVVQ